MASRSDVLATHDGVEPAIEPQIVSAQVAPPEAARPKRTLRPLALLALLAAIGFVGYGAAHASSPSDFARYLIAAGTALGGIIVYTLIPFLALVLTLITVHELGHYAAARYAGLEVLDFSIGMGKAIYQRRGRHNTWTLRLLPLGGYVRVSEEGPRGLNAASTMTRIGFTAAGPAVNIVLAFLFFVIAFGQGLTFTRNVVAEVIPGSPAAVAGVQPGDRIVTINGVGVRSFDDILVGSMYGSDTQVDRLGIERAAAHSIQTLNLDVGRQNRIYGVRFKREQADGLGSAMAMARDQMAASVWSMIHLPFLVSANGGDPITVFSGPVGIAHVTGDVVRSPNAGLVGLQLIALLNLGLAVINLLPLPIFDGGRILIYAIEGLVHRRTPVRLQNFMAGASLGVILMFGTVITAKDIIELVSG